MTTITAKYPGQCNACGRYHIKPGDTIKSLDQGGWAPINCPALKHTEVMQRYLVKQAQKTRAKEMTAAHMATDALTAGGKGRCNNDEIVAQERAAFAKRTEDLSWAGKEEFYG